MNPQRAAQLLSRTEIFRHLDARALEDLSRAAVLRSYKRGQALFHQGDPGSSLFVIVEGLIKVYVVSPEGGEMVLVTLQPLDTVGDLAVLDGEPRSASAEALKRSSLLVLTRDKMLDALKANALLGEAMLRSLGGVVRRLTDQVADLVFLDLHGRVAKLLVQLAERHGAPSDQGTVLDLRFTQTDLARMVGGSRQSVNQILHTFEERGYLDLDHRRIIVKKPDLLADRARS